MLNLQSLNHFMMVISLCSIGGLLLLITAIKVGKDFTEGQNNLLTKSADLKRSISFDICIGPSQPHLSFLAASLSVKKILLLSLVSHPLPIADHSREQH